jgi:mannosyltransferase OCH1-like enzyme
MIPKQFHVIWLGTVEMPSLFRRWIDQWAILHPEWTTTMWGDNVVDELPSNLRPTFEASRSWSAKSDVARIAVVHKYGGVYHDTDYRPLKAIDPLLVGCRAFAMIERPNGRLTGSLFGAEARHPFISDLVNAAPRHFDPENPMKAGPLLFNAVFYKGRGDVRVFERSVFSPLLSSQRKHAEHGEFPESYCVHAYAGSWRKNRRPPEDVRSR